jgi:hypothetical protein
MILAAYVLTEAGAFKIAEATGATDIDVVGLQDGLLDFVDRRLRELDGFKVTRGMIAGPRDTLKLNCAIYNDINDFIKYVKNAA